MNSITSTRTSSFSLQSLQSSQNTSTARKNSLKFSLISLPDYLITSQIFPFLTTKELFFSLRGVCSEFLDMVKNKWGSSIKEEMCSQLKTLSVIYEKDALTKAYEFKLQYLVNYRTLITMYNVNADIMLIIHDIMDQIEDREIFKMISVFFGILGQEELLNLLYAESIEINERKNMLKERLTSNEVKEDYNEKFNIILDISSVESDPQVFGELVNDFNMLNREAIESTNENARFIYSFLQGILEYEQLKTNVKELKIQVENLFKKIQRETQMWPKKKKFFENSYKFLYLTQPSNKRTNFIRKKLEEFRLKNPMSEFKEEAYYKMLELKEKMEGKKKEIMELKSSSLSNTISTETEMQKINELFFSNLLERRVLLTQKIRVLEKFYDIFAACQKFDVSGKPFFAVCEHKIEKESMFFFVLSVTYKNKGEGMGVGDLRETYEIFLKSNDEKASKTCDEKQKLILKMKENEKKLEALKEKQIQNLKEQKNNLMIQKKKTEQLLGVLKKYMNIKECMLKNKEKYKIILHLLQKLKSSSFSNSPSAPNSPGSLSLPAIEKTISELDLNSLADSDFDSAALSEAERKELENFQKNDGLLKEIEEKLMEQINLCVGGREEEEEKCAEEKKEDKGEKKDV